MLKIVTFTGADDSILPGELMSLQSDFPFIEWGLLLSRSSQGDNRFPSNQFLDHIFNTYKDLNLSGHLCGSYVRELLIGKTAFLKEIPSWDMFKRVQINTHGHIHSFDSQRLAEVIKSFPDKEFIFQYDNANVEIIEAIMKRGINNISTLFDLSHGAGVLPKEWPDPVPGLKCGYAGGISPSNIAEQIVQVELKAGDLETWVDMETWVRSHDDKLFDLGKVKACSEISAFYIK